MPKYLYDCKKHGNIEINHPMSEAGRPIACPLCLDEEVKEPNFLERIWSPTTPIFKGGGWFADGYNKGGSK